MTAAPKNATLTFRILGSGSSPGNPRIGNDWGRCDPAEPKNRRRRASLLVTRTAADGRKTRLLVDAGPDLREQMLDARVDWVDGVVFTHAHADHCHGIDDLRSFVLNRRQLVDVWVDEATSKRLHEAFGYCFQTPPGSAYPPIINEHRLTVGHPVTIQGEGGAIPLLPFRQIHGDIVDPRRAAVEVASEPFLGRRGAGLDRPQDAETRGADPSPQRHRLPRARRLCAAGRGTRLGRTGTDLSRGMTEGHLPYNALILL